MELWDVVDRDGRPTGRTMTRGSRAAPGDYHVVVHVWIADESGLWLIQRRAPHVESDPDIWACTGGSVLAGEDSRSAAVRETQEELGVTLDPAALIPGPRKLWPGAISHAWLLRTWRGSLGAIHPGPEVSRVMWAAGDEILEMVARRDFYDYGREYFEQIGIGNEAHPNRGGGR